MKAQGGEHWGWGITNSCSPQSTNPLGYPTSLALLNSTGLSVPLSAALSASIFCFKNFLKDQFEFVFQCPSVEYTYFSLSTINMSFSKLLINGNLQSVNSNSKIHICIQEDSMYFYNRKIFSKAKTLIAKSHFFPTFPQFICSNDFWLLQLYVLNAWTLTDFLTTNTLWTWRSARSVVLKVCSPDQYHQNHWEHVRNAIVRPHQRL